MSTRNTIITAVLAALITSICTVFVIDFIKRPKEVTVPSILGLKPSQALDVLAGRKLRLQIIERRPDAKYRVPGVICYQRPLTNSKLLQGSTIIAVISAGPPKVKVPVCASLPLAQFKSRLAAAELKLGANTQQIHATLAPGTVISCSPAPGTSLSPGAVVSVVVAKKQEAIEMPKLRGSCSRAKKAIVKLGLVVGRVSWSETGRSGNVVIWHKPKAKEMVKPGDKVRLHCNRDD